MSERARRYKPIAILLAVFALGAVAGVGGMRAFELRELEGTMGRPPSEARARFRLEAMRRRLDLSDEQQTKLEAILRAAEDERERALASCRPGLDSLRDKTDAEIEAILTPEQREEHRRFVERRRQRGPRHGPPH
jgi:Spy/CpxP family protein refolding chaperone